MINNKISREQLKEEIIDMKIIGKKTVIKTSQTNGLNVGQYIVLNYTNDVLDYKYNHGKKYKILELTKNTITIKLVVFVLLSNDIIVYVYIYKYYIFPNCEVISSTVVSLYFS